MHALLGPRWRRPRTCMHQSVSDWLFEIRYERRHEIHSRGACEATARQFWLAECRSLRSTIGRRDARDLCTPRRYRSRALRQSAEESADPMELHDLEVAVLAPAWHFRAVRFSRPTYALR